jgi:DNA polymerase-3 subunit epsilon
LKYAIVDIETTGGQPPADRITEIAIYIHDGEKIIDEFSSLINPERAIPPYVSRLTGISDEMVAAAPRFYEVAKQIVELTEDCVFIAHNVQFDYNFVRQEFKSLGFNYTRDFACTVKLSRKLLPGHPSYSLGNLCTRLGIHLENRHRAGGDALATVRLFEMLLMNDKENFIGQSIKSDYLNLRFPPDFNRTIIDKLPEESGVYYFHNEDGSIIYIGKSNNIRKRILSHFANKQSKKAIELRNAIRDISFEKTGNELVALLLESDEIKTHQPLFNRAQRRTLFTYGILLDESSPYMQLKPAKIRTSDDPLVTAATMEEAKALLEKLVLQFNLCQKLCGIYPAVHACFRHSIGRCNGACVGKESSELYNERVRKATDSLVFKHANFLILGKGRTPGEKTVVRVEKGRYLGFGYIDQEQSAAGMEDLFDAVKPRMDTRDTQRIIRSFLREGRSEKVIPY